VASATRQLPYIESQRTLFRFQLKSLVAVALGAVLVTVIGWIFPTFFDYHYLTWGGFAAVERFWPLLAEGIVLNLVIWYFGSPGWPIRLSDNFNLLRWQLTTAVLAGIWEELGYRWVFACFAMIGILVVNWILSAGLGWSITIVSGIAMLVLVHQRNSTLGWIALVVCALAVVFALYANPVYWFYELFVWVIHFTTFTLMDPVLYGDHKRLLIFGAVVANSWFRDGHKYQGPVGLVNSWYAGMTLLYATIMYGLGTAIVVHALYNIGVHVLRFVLQKMKW
jgi:hypothetical protein